MDTYELGYGLVRTRSGRITYAADGQTHDGQQPHFRPLWPNEPQTSDPNSVYSDDEGSAGEEPEAAIFSDDDDDDYPHQQPPRLPNAAYIANEQRAMRHRSANDMLGPSRASRASVGPSPEPEGMPSNFRVPDDSFLQRSYSDAADSEGHRRSARAPSRRSEISGTTYYNRSSRSISRYEDFDDEVRRRNRVRNRASQASRASSRAMSRRSSFVSYGEASTQVDEAEFVPPSKSAKYVSGGTTMADKDDLYNLSHDPERHAESKPKPAGPPPGAGGPPGGGPPWLQNNYSDDPNVVTWKGKDDPENPMNWTRAKKWRATILLAMMTFCVTFASSVFSTATTQTAAQYGVSMEVMTLATSLFVLGFAFGPIVFGPLSEVFGRKVPLYIGFFSFAIFQIAVAVSQNLYTIMICRFFGGFFASAPLAIVGGTMNDFWEPVDRGVAVTIFSSAVFVGPVAGPIAGSFIVTSYLGWRWTEWITAIIAFFFGALGFLFVPESFAPVLLQQKAKKIKYQTKNWAIHAKADETEINLKRIGDTYLIKPFKMLAMEPILVLITIYMSLIYGILYLCFFAYPISFSEKRGWTEGLASLPFVAIIVGVGCAAVLIIVITKTRFARIMRETGRVVPEERLVPMFVGGAVLPAGLFWFAWTSDPNISYWPQVISGILIGMGLMTIFLQGLNYIIDVYKMNAASAIAANTFARSWVGAIFPLFATYMYNGLGIAWATSVLGFACVALYPVPILFFLYGAKIRAKGKFVPQFPPGGPPGGKPGGGPPGGGPPGGKPGGGPPGMSGPPGGGPPPGVAGGKPPGAGGPPPGVAAGGKPSGAGGPPGSEGKPTLPRTTSSSPTALPAFPASTAGPPAGSKDRGV